MSEIAKCPRCGETPKRIQYKAGGFGHSCCGAEFFCTTYWNQYAAAMELARELVNLEKCEVIGPEYHRLEKSIAQMEYRVIKIFGGE